MGIPFLFSSQVLCTIRSSYEYFCELCRLEIPHVARGVFGADMELSIINEGPVTIVMDSKVLLKKGI